MNFIYQFAILLTNQLVASTSLQDIGTGLEILFQLEFAGPYQSLVQSGFWSEFETIFLVRYMIRTRIWSGQQYRYKSISVRFWSRLKFRKIKNPENFGKMIVKVNSVGKLIFELNEQYPNPFFHENTLGKEDPWFIFFDTLDTLRPIFWGEFGVKKTMVT